jgi:hypothetical protein
MMTKKTLRTAAQIGALMVVVLIVVKVAGLTLGGTGDISRARIAVVPLATADADDRALAASLQYHLADAISSLAGHSAVVTGMRPPGFGTAEVNRQIRFNYQVGSILTGTVGRANGVTTVDVSYLNTANDAVDWTITAGGAADSAFVESVVERVIRRLQAPESDQR